MFAFPKAGKGLSQIIPTTIEVSHLLFFFLLSIVLHAECEHCVQWFCVNTRALGHIKLGSNKFYAVGFFCSFK